MCLICSEWELGKLTNKEALRNLGEMIDFEENEQKKEHFLKTAERIIDVEISSEEEAVDNSDDFSDLREVYYWEEE
jgi:hypothetical protein